MTDLWLSRSDVLQSVDMQVFLACWTLQLSNQISSDAINLLSLIRTIVAPNTDVNDVDPSFRLLYKCQQRLLRSRPPYYNRIFNISENLPAVPRFPIFTVLDPERRRPRDCSLNNISPFHCSTRATFFTVALASVRRLMKATATQIKA